MNHLTFARRMAVLAGVLLASACETFQLESPARQAAPDAGIADPQAEERQVIALVNSRDAAFLLEEKARRRGYRLIDKEVLPGLDYVLLEFDAPLGLDTAIASEELEKLEPHATADENHFYTLHGRERSHEQGARRADWTLRRGAAGAGTPPVNPQAAACAPARVVGMIDSDVALEAPALEGAPIRIRRFVSANAPASPMSHGTAVAELLMREGRMADAMLYSAVVIDERGRGVSTVAALIRALDWMAQSGVEIVNISLAGPYNKSLDRAVQRLARQNVVIVAAVGNDGPKAAPRYPAAFDQVIAVTAVDEGGRVFSQAVRGAHVDFSALGVDVFVRASGAGRFISGTSYAAPMVTSLIAAHPSPAQGFSAKTIRRQLIDRAADLGAEGRDPVFGYGLVSPDLVCASQPRARQASAR